MEYNFIDKMLNESKKAASIWSGFHQKTLQDRITLLKKIYPSFDDKVLKSGGLSLEMADMMIENCIGLISLPLGLGLNFEINGEKYTIPMAIEEPSVVAAASSAAKFISEKGTGFKMFATDPIMAAQIQIIGVNYDSLKYVIEENRQEIINHANTHCKSMVKRGGGVKNIRHRKLYQIITDDEFKDVIAIELLVNVQESMGMNICNTIAEKTSVFIKKLIGNGKIGLRITTNLCLERMASAFFKIPVENLSWKTMSGREVANGILNAYQFALNDKFRCCTHNKGIMNGIDAVAVALGQDWRAIESAAHAYASLDDGYKPLTQYKIAKDAQGAECLMGKIELPLACASKGGALATSKAYLLTHMILKNPSGRQIAGILACVGLAQNFAAIKALAVEGIQKGHMNLHARNIAVSAGTPPHLINEVVDYMIQKDSINVETAKLYMDTHNIRESSALVEDKNKIKDQQLSLFFIEINHPMLTESIKLNLVFATPEGIEPINLQMMKDEEATQLQKELFLNHSYKWILKVMLLLDSFKTAPGLIDGDKTKLLSLRYRLKLIMVLIGHIINVIHLKYNGEGLENIIKMCKGEPIQYSISKEAFFIHNILIELIATYKSYANANIQNPSIKKAMMKEIIETLEGLHELQKFKIGTYRLTIKEFPKYMNYRRKRLSLTQVMLIDVLCCDEKSIPNEYIDNLVCLGKLVELKAVAIRDLYKLGTQDIIHNNCYEEWCKINGIEDMYREVHKLEFLNVIEDMITQNMEECQKLVGSDTIVNKVNIDEYLKVVEDYYSHRIQ